LDIFDLALDVDQVEVSHAVFIDNTPMFVQIAQGLGVKNILHADLRSTRVMLSAIGLKVDK
jgi:putative hydrolase of the HAD superfamily